MNNDTMDLTIKMREKLLDKIIAELTASEKEEMNTKQNRYLHTQDATTKTPEELLSKFIKELTAPEKKETNTKHNRYVDPCVNIQDVTIVPMKAMKAMKAAMMDIATVPMKAMRTMKAIGAIEMLEKLLDKLIVKTETMNALKSMM